MILEAPVCGGVDWLFQPVLLSILCERGEQCLRDHSYSGCWTLHVQVVVLQTKAGDCMVAAKFYSHYGSEFFNAGVFFGTMIASKIGGCYYFRNFARLQFMQLPCSGCKHGCYIQLEYNAMCVLCTFQVQYNVLCSHLVLPWICIVFELAALFLRQALHCIRPLPAQDTTRHNRKHNCFSNQLEATRLFPPTHCLIGSPQPLCLGTICQIFSLSIKHPAQRAQRIQSIT